MEEQRFYESTDINELFKTFIFISITLFTYKYYFIYYIFRYRTDSLEKCRQLENSTERNQYFLII